jgi:NADH-quinone oxidoreductase subunit E
MDIKRVEQIIDGYQGKDSALIQILLDIQNENHWLPKEALEKVSQRLNVPLSKVMNTATFHKTFSLIPEGLHEIHVCNGSSCHVRGAQRIIDAVQETTGIAPGETGHDMKYSLKTTTCMGCCTSGPVMVVDGKYHSNVEVEQAGQIIKQSDKG